MVIVTRSDRHHPAGERDDKYAEAVAWEAASTGALTVLGGGANALATYPQGVWLRVRKGDPESD